LSVLFEPLHPGVAPPERATRGSAGFDLRAYLAGRRVRCSDGVSIWETDASNGAGEWSIELAPGTMALIPLGFRARLPEGYEAQVRPRSGVSFRKGLQIPNAPGTVDADYPDEWLVPVRNATSAPMRIEHGERIAQAVFQRYEVLGWEAGPVRATTDRAGGFGSTGR
jgi:dUTP pyrophosphatase